MKHIKPRLKPSHNVTQSANGDIAIGDLNRNSYVVRQPPQAYIDLLVLLDGTRTLPRLVRAMQQKGHDVSEAFIESLVQQLSDAHLVDDAARESSVLSPREVQRYDRQQLQFSAYETGGEPGFTYQERLKAQKVCILGMGGWGTWLSLNLALLGFGGLRLIDADHVELSNLNRQVLYDESSLGLDKVEAAKAALARINPHVEVEAIREFIEPDEAQIERALDGVTLACLCWSNQSHFVKNTAEEIVHKVALRRGIPILEIAGDPFDISVGPLFMNNGTGPCLRCIREQMQDLWWGADETVTAFRKSYAQIKPIRKVNAWQSGPSLSALAGLASNEAMTLASGYAEPGLIGKRLNVSLQSYETSMDEFTKQPDCEWCSEVTA